MLRTLQKEKLSKMLMPEDPPFKILLLDTTTQEILSPILKVSDLRDAGVTSHFLVENHRSQIKDVPAVYFTSTADGIANDLDKDLYGSYYLNASTSFKRSDLEALAGTASQKKIAFKVLSVFDQFLQYISLQETLFTFNIPDSYKNRNETECLRKASLGLFSIFVTLNEIPFIVGSNAEIGKMLDQKIRSTKIIKGGIKKPLLLILDRNFDLITPIRHVMGYVELIHDLFNMKLNKIEGINIDTDSEFYKTNCFSDFPTVAEIVEKELHSYKKELAIRSLTEKSDKAEIQAALESAPHIQKKGEIVNSNLNVCMKILEEMKKRKIDDFYRMEEAFDQNSLVELCTHGNENDIIRFCLTLLNTKNSELIKPILEKRKIDDGIISYFGREIKEEGGFGSKMKSLLFKRNLPIYTYLENVVGQVKSQTYQDRVFDPEGKGVYLSQVSKIVVYVHGGATYSELKAMNEFEKAYKIPVILGGSEILNADELIKQVGDME